MHRARNKLFWVVFLSRHGSLCMFKNHNMIKVVAYLNRLPIYVFIFQNEELPNSVKAFLWYENIWRNTEYFENIRMKSYFHYIFTKQIPFKFFQNPTHAILCGKENCLSVWNVLPAKKRQNLGAFKEIEARLTYSCTFVC